MCIVGIIERNIGLIENETFRPLKVELVGKDNEGHYIIDEMGKNEYIDINDKTLNFRSLAYFNQNINVTDFESDRSLQAVILPGEKLVVGKAEYIYGGYQECFGIDNRTEAVRTINTLADLKLYKEALMICESIKQDQSKYKKVNVLNYIDNKVKELQKTL